MSGFWFRLAPSVVGAQPSRAVDANIVVAIDVSGSIDGFAERLELEGVAEALVHPAFLNAVARGRHGSIGFAAFTWSSQGDFVEIVRWHRVDVLDDLERIAEQLGAPRRVARSRLLRRPDDRPWRTDLGTDVSEALVMGTRLLEQSPFTSDRALLNICANGDDNIGEPPDAARDRALAAGITINAMILRDQPDVAAYFRRHVRGGPGSFVLSVSDFDDVIDAMLAKFMLELAHGWRVPTWDNNGRIMALVGLL